MVTQQQIARKLGVSRQLVTFALAGYPKVSEASRKRIVAAAEKMGYRANPHARALKRARTGIISLWVPNQISTYYNQVVRELSQLAKKAGSELIVSEVGASDASQILSHVPVDGRLVVDVPEQVQVYGQTPNVPQVPAVSMGAHCYEEIDYVKVDLLAGTTAAMKHLLESGFRRIAHATFVREDSVQASRRAGYIKALREAGIQPEFIYHPFSEGQRPIVRQLIQTYILDHGRPEAIFCHSDDAAMAIYRGLCDMKLRVPQDVALVGCDGIPDTEYLECPLTTIVQPIKQMCSVAWQFLMHRIECPGASHQHVDLVPELVVRASSRQAS